MAQTAVIMQPTYLPWLGYFDLIDQSDVFVFLDDVQFSKQSWHQRNRIRTPKGLEWLTVPVRREGRLHLLIREVKIVQGTYFPRGHIRGIEFNYKGAPYFDTYFPKLREILTKSGSQLCELSIRLIRWLASEIGIVGRFEISSALGAQGRRSELMVDICMRVGAEMCLSPTGSATYLAEEHEIPRRNDIEISFQNYDHPKYRQVFEPFIPYASVIDLLFNEGDKSLGIIRSGRKDSLTLQDILEE